MENKNTKVSEADFNIRVIPLYGHSLNNKCALSDMLETLFKIYNESSDPDYDKLVFANYCKHLSFIATDIIRNDPCGMKYNKLLRNNKNVDVVSNYVGKIIETATKKIMENPNIDNILAKSFGEFIGATYLLASNFALENEFYKNSKYIHKVWFDYNRKAETVSLKIYTLPMGVEPKDFNYKTIVTHVRVLKENRFKKKEVEETTKAKEKETPFNGIRIRG